MVVGNMLLSMVYLLIINAVAFLTMATDKRRAKKGKWRVPEKTLFFQAVLGGSIGALLGMYTFRHKTKHRRFVIEMPLVLLAQICVVLALMYWF